MHDVLLRHVTSGRLPGLVALISRHGAEHLDAIGTLAFDRTAPMRRDTIFRAASVTSPITAVAAMILVEECRLRLDDPVDGFLPELANPRALRSIDSELDDTVPARRPITVRDLLTFRSGYGEVAFLSPTCPLQRALMDARLPLSAWTFPGTPDDFMQRLGRLPLAHQPGAFESGAGDQFVSTADDLLAFGRMMLNRGAYGNARILSRPSVELMTTDQLTPEQKAASPFFAHFWDSRGWGLGLSIVTRRDDVAAVPGRFGWDGAFSTSWYADPHEDLVGVLMAQCRPGALRLPPVVLDFWTSAYQAIDD
jgi:CubicO group peptidase (beta-lactamase class C family)